MQRGVNPYDGHQAKEMVNSGALGKVVSTTINVSESLYLKMPERVRYVNDPKIGLCFPSELSSWPMEMD